MHIQIDDNYAIGSDKYQFIIKEKTMRKNKETGKMEVYWRPDCYFTKMSSVVDYLVQQSLRESEAQTLATLVEDQQNAVRKLTLALEGKYKVIPA